MTLIPTPRRPYDDPCSSRVNFWTEMPREGASLGAQTMPDTVNSYREGKDVVLNGQEIVKAQIMIFVVFHILRMSSQCFRRRSNIQLKLNNLTAAHPDDMNARSAF